MNAFDRPPVVPGLLTEPVLLLRRFLLALADAIVPAQLPLFELATGGIAARAVRAAVELGVPEELDAGPKDAAELASALEVLEDPLHRVLRVSAQAGVFRLRRDGRFAHNRRSRLLRREAEAGFRAPLRYFASEEIALAWSGIEGALRTGVDGYQQRHGVSVWDWYEQRPEERQRFAESMTAISALEAPAIARFYPWGRCRRVCDVGGGRGVVLAEILRRHPNVKGVLIDSPGVIPLARERFASLGLLERVELVPGSFFEAIPAGCDALLLKNVLHDWDDEACRTILSACRRAVDPGARLVIAEMLLERNELRDTAVRSDLHMLLATTRGRERSRVEIARLLAAGGFELTAVKALPGDQRLAEGRAK